MNYVKNIFLHTYYNIENKNEITGKINFEMIGFSSSDIIIIYYHVVTKYLAKSLFLPKTVYDKFYFTTSKNLANASFP